ncbi:MAG: phage major capsid protein [Methanophagales archaeon]|nr:phage major capsid protein [Methanophagales archaeon]
MADSGFVDISKITDVKERVIVKQVLGLAKKEMELRKICRVIPMPELTAEIRIATSLAGVRHVKELEEAKLDSVAYTKVNFDLAAFGKNVVHVAVSEEAERQSNVDLLQMNTQDAATALAQMENQDIVEALDALPATNDVTGSDWGDANDPSDDIMAAVTHIASLRKGLTADTIVMYPTLYGKLVSNEEVKKYIRKDSITEKGKLGEICGLKIISHPAMQFATNYTSTCYVLDSKAPALALGDGPKMAKKIDGGAKFYNAIAIAQWEQPKLVLSDAVVRIKSV